MLSHKTLATINEICMSVALDMLEHHKDFKIGAYKGLARVHVYTSFCRPITKASERREIDKEIERRSSEIEKQCIKIMSKFKE